MTLSRLLGVLACVVGTAMLWTPGAAKDVSVMIATWRGCEEACKGFQDYLNKRGHGVRFTVVDAAQEKERLTEMRSEARAGGFDLVLSWGTSVTKAIAGDMSQLDDPAYNHEIPQVFMIVADPVGSGVISSLDDTGRPNVTGTYNRMPETVTIETIRRYSPQFRRLGLLYNENEPNSVLKHQELLKLAESQGFELVALALAIGDDGMPLAEDIAPKVRELAKAEVDFIYVGSSSFLRANGSFLGSAVKDAKVPLITPYEDSVHNGNALISVAASYYEIGRLAGRQAERILFEGASPGQLPVSRMEEFAVTINLSVAKQIGRFPPVELLQIAEIVE